jgi:hypothetical protein
VLLAFGSLVVLAVFSLGTLPSIFVAAVLALGLDPVVAALQRRGWGRGRAALAVFAALFAGATAIVAFTAAPLWEELLEFANALPGYWDDLTQTAAFEDFVSTAGVDDTIRNALKDLAAGLPDAANALLGIAAGVFGSVLSLVTLTFLSLFLLMERVTITNWLFGFATPEVERRWRPVLGDSISAVSSSLIGNVAVSLVAAGLRAVGLGVRAPVPDCARRDHRVPRPDPAGRRDDRGGDPRRGRADRKHADRDRDAHHPADLPADRELHPLLESGHRAARGGSAPRLHQALATELADPAGRCDCPRQPG